MIVIFLVAVNLNVKVCSVEVIAPVTNVSVAVLMWEKLFLLFKNSEFSV